jgi:hypothetical protein
MAMACISIRKAAAAGLLFGGTLGLAAPAVGGVTVLDSQGLLTIVSPPISTPAEQSSGFVPGPWSATGSWGSLTVSGSSAGFSASASTNNVDGATQTDFDWSLGYIFTADTPTRVTINYTRFAGTIGSTILQLVELDGEGEPVGSPIWSLPSQASGGWFVDILAPAERVFAIGYQEQWSTSSASQVTGGISVTFSAVPAPGAAALLGAAGLLGSRRRR